MRSLWRGSLSFGLVNIPVRMYKACSQRELTFKLLHKKDLGRIRYARICTLDGKETPWEEVVKGYEVDKGNYVILTEEDFEKADQKLTRTIEILDFTDEDQIDTMYYDTPYYLEPEKNASKAYCLICEALKRTKKVAVGQFVFHHHEHIGVLRAHQNMLILQKLRYHSEIVSSKELKIPHVKVSKTELSMALKLIDELSHPFKPEKYSDTYVDSVKSIIKKKSKGQKIAVKKDKGAESEKVQDILALLKKSLTQDSKKKSKRRKAA